ncbi:extracellular solute-binding protein [Mesorhizobium sp. BAC0120]|uniref:extracellular solute-binding protein n=1 Tax=Mesorhizobium sp. BAC0120 TaxID=3090670 RepID=UPI00298D5BFA|nr:extracellular solute-binding protein [Mesorhizobium sp. BAC0120]MDW6025985.1 extracellular solute-binding protein [Mesorhizobium sp. BAC0120]
MNEGLIFSRRNFLALGAAAATAPLFRNLAFAAVPTGQPLHGLSAFGDLKYGPDFKNFDYVNVDAPKGGTFNYGPSQWVYNQNPYTFNTLNSFVIKGDAPPRIEICFDSLLTSALDEPDAIYGLLASTVTVSADRNSFEFALRPEARFHDGSHLTAHDAAFTFNLFKEKGHPDLLLPLRELTEAVALDDGVLRLTFSGKQSDRTILDVATFPILSKAYFDKVSFDSSRMDPPLGSGPYRVGLVRAGQTIEYERVPDYWGRDLPVNRGMYNFDRLRIEFYGDRQAAFEAFKKGEVHFREEATSRMWATSYDFPAIKAGKVVKREFPAEKRPSMQATAVNLRRERFRDVRVRRAIAMCFDFEWTNRTLFYGLYNRSQSCFERSDFKASGKPGPDELALLEPMRDKLPPEVFDDAFQLPASDGSGRDRKLLGEARKLMIAAGWKPSGRLLQNEAGQSFGVEVLVDDESFVRVYSPWVENMKAIGIDASLRVVESAQHQQRQANFDFDMIGMALLFSPTPTREGMDGIFHSRSANLNGSRNLPGTADPAIDALVEAIDRVTNRHQLTTVMCCLDRLLRARMDWIPSWYSPSHRNAFWDMFGFKEPKPDYGFSPESLWWFDEAKAKAIGKG